MAGKPSSLARTFTFDAARARGGILVAQLFSLVTSLIADLVIGHYWFDSAEGIKPASSQVACVDYSVARGGPLVAYRFDGEEELSSEKFVAVGVGS
jgi:hypothetical protein